MDSTLRLLLAIPWAVHSLQFRDGIEIEILETDGVSRLGATMTFDQRVNKPIEGLIGQVPGMPDYVTHHQNHRKTSDEAGSEWPDTWLHALNHGGMIAQLLDNQSLWDMTHASTGKPPFHYQAESKGLPEFNIPAMKMQHAVPGFQARDQSERKRVTAFPSYMCLASSWDKELVYEVAMAVSKEFKDLGANVMLGPSINIHRATQHDEEFDSLSGEDPTLGSVLVRSWILATQTHGIMSVPKYIGMAEQDPVHFENSSANVTAWDIYYPPIQTAADCGAAGFMCARHEINGLWACRDSVMLMRDLREMMHFHGMIVSDINSAREYFNYASSFEKGLDLELAEDTIVPWSEHAQKAMRKAAKRIIASEWHMNLEEHAGCQPGHCVEYLNRTVTSKDHREVARRATAAGVILLKNERDILPITSGTVAVIDATKQTPEYCLSDLEHPETEDICKSPFDAVYSHGIDRNINVVKDMSQAGICVVIGEATGQTHWQVDSSTEVAIKLASTTCPYIIAFLQTRGAVLTPWRDDLAALAILHHTGEEAAYAWSCIVFGDCNPSGHLVVGMPANMQDIEEWWYEKAPSYWDPTMQFAFPFGHGLSYSRFAYSDIKDKPGCRAPLCIQLDVMNESPTYAGQETIQVYFKFGAEEHHPMVLRGFHKTRLLFPGEFERVFFPFTYRDLSLYHDIGNHAEPETSWRPEHTIQVLVGPSSRNIKARRYEHPRGV